MDRAVIIRLREWIDVTEALPQPVHSGDTSPYVIVWVQCRHDVGFWAGDRFDHSRGEWEIHGSYEGATVTHWMDGPDAPRNPS
jgi:hypothetical protein